MPPFYREALRPQFHFTAKTGWLNDPNGLVFYGGEYHLFFQHNPFGVTWGNMTWGHAVSKDLVHWEQLPNAIEPDARGTIYSGSAVVDWNNTAGFGREALVALYTAAGECAKPPAPTTQGLASSTDRGRTWMKYAGNPVLPEIAPGNRDPRVFWHAPTKRWIMALYVGGAGRPDGQAFRFFSSGDLKSWGPLGELEGFYECPELFELDGRWVMFGADGRYAVGRFDGTSFTVESGKHGSDWGANFYAGQTFNDVPASDGRRILVGWMRDGKYPDMPFNQQMSFPCEMTLREGRLCKWPVREIAALVVATREATEVEGELFDLEAEIDPGHALEFGFDVRGHAVSWLAGDQQLRLGASTAPLPLANGRVRLRLLVDRTSIEVFGNDGRVTISQCFLPHAENRRVRFFSRGGKARITSLAVRELKSIWAG